MDNNNYVWHVTPSINIPSIMKHGLKPNIPESGGDLAISLFKTKEYAIIETNKWLKSKYNNEPLSLLRISTKNLELTETFLFELITTNLNPILPVNILEIIGFEVDLSISKNNKVKI